MPIILGKVYANWCGHCQSLKPEWSKMKSSLIKNKNISFVEIEEQQTKKLEKFKKKYPHLEVNGYPTIFKILPNGQIEYFSGNRTAHEMKQWALKSSTLPKNTKKFLHKPLGKTRKHRNSIFSLW